MACRVSCWPLPREPSPVQVTREGPRQGACEQGLEAQSWGRCAREEATGAQRRGPGGCRRQQRPHAGARSHHALPRARKQDCWLLVGSPWPSTLHRAQPPAHVALRTLVWQL